MLRLLPSSRMQRASPTRRSTWDILDNLRDRRSDSSIAFAATVQIGDSLTRNPAPPASSTRKPGTCTAHPASWRKLSLVNRFNSLR